MRATPESRPLRRHATAAPAPGRRLCVLALALLALAPLRAAAELGAAAEYQIKATFLVRFGSYVEWPAPSFDKRDSPFVIGVLASGAVYDEIERAAAGAVVDGRPVQVRRLERPEGNPGVHLLFIDRSHSGQLADTLAQLRGRPLLTVAETEQALALGVMVNFVIVENKVRFDIALAPAEASQLKISARLLAVARRVVKG